MESSWLASVRMDFLRVFSFDATELRGTMKSLLRWAVVRLLEPWRTIHRNRRGKTISSRLVVFGRKGRRARTEGTNRGWSVVAFDHCITSVQDCDAPAEFSGSDETMAQFNGNRERANSAQSRLSKQNSTNGSVTYRFGSVGQDTQLCLWDLTEDVLFPLSRTRTQPTQWARKPALMETIARTLRYRARIVCSTRRSAAQTATNQPASSTALWSRQASASSRR